MSRSSAPARPAQQPGGGWPSAGDGRGRSGTGGAARGTGGLLEGGLERLRGVEGRDLMIGGLVIGVAAAAVTVVNALTVQVDNPEIAAWEPWVWEATSAVVVTLLAWLPWLSTAAAPPEMVRDGWRARAVFAGVHLTVAAIWSALHVLGMMSLRLAIYDWAEAVPYEPGPAGEVYLYEFRKDLISYAAFVAVFWILRRLRRPEQPTLRPVSFDIRDGARIIRAPVGDILAVSSAQNYVEFWLADGRRPLMRATLAAIEGELETYGFVRTHRSWLVNGTRVTGLIPDGSGDWTVELGEVRVPLSRRFPEALARLKG
ncbi:LytTR family DNA-binding domain-containing protein [Brevundimonas sp.]|uniref:LytTR family DNA-binding domain-containing protein n=1 Tax=Brevundimonas sp. TaxID=1871086 RepID=UPI0022C9D513|nr:LytTR family DNA-binding domain-containing protein [Brevundimonas sp.]MCZ8193890.1 LytTR family DNA-binding domain-containing protein [Brevundimonas sp.]